MKESKEALIALAVLGKLVSDRLKDGVDLSDAIAIGQALLVDGEIKAKVEAGYKDADKIDEEFKDFSIAKAIELAAVLPELAAILQKKSA
jgi:hypothetical protein